MGYFIVMLWIVVLPFIVGTLLVEEHTQHRIIKQWLYGQFLLWASFQIVAVWLILQMQSIDLLVDRYIVVVLVLLTAAVVVMLKKVVKHGYKREAIKLPEFHAVTVIFVALFLVQLAAMLFLAVNDGDDAYYMAIANIAQSGGNMYTVNAYSFGMVALNYRYALAPFPIWIAFLTEISGLHTLVIGHVILGVFMLFFFYAIQYLLAHELLEGKKQEIWLFMLFVAGLVVWGNTSTHTAASFLITRSRQGKALVASIVLPMLWFLLTYCMRRLQNKEKIGYRYYIVVATVMLTASLGSSMGGALCLLIWGSFCFMSSVFYKKPGVLLAGIASSLPTLVFAVLYLFQGG